MKQIHHLTQNTPEWHQYRNTRYGASDHAAAMQGGQTSIIKDKIFPKSNSDNQYSAWGQMREPVIRECLGDHCKIFTGAMVVESEKNPRVYASFDCFCDLIKKTVEIKTCKFQGEKFQEWSNQMSHQHYVINDSEYEPYLAVERYITKKIEDKNGKIKEIPDKAVELNVYQAALIQIDESNAKIFFKKIAQFSINEHTGEYKRLAEDQMTDTTVEFYNIKSQNAWNKQCDEFLFELDNAIYQNNGHSEEHGNLNGQLAKYKTITAQIEELKLHQEGIKEAIIKNMNNQDLCVYKSPSGVSVTISERKKPMTETFIKSKIDVSTLTQEFYKSVLDIEKIVKVYEIEPEHTQTVTIK